MELPKASLGEASIFLTEGMTVLVRASVWRLPTKTARNVSAPCLARLCAAAPLQALRHAGEIVSAALEEVVECEVKSAGPSMKVRAAMLRLRATAHEGWPP